MMQLTAVSKQDAVTLKTDIDKAVISTLILKHRQQALDQVKLQYKQQIKRIKNKKSKKSKKGKIINNNSSDGKDVDDDNSKLVLKDNTIIDLTNVGKIDGIDYSFNGNGNNNNMYKDKLIVRYLSDITLIEFRKRKCRLIIRNLSFQATEQNVIDKLSSYGPIVSVELPKRTVILSNNGKGGRRNDVSDDKKKAIVQVDNDDDGDDDNNDDYNNDDNSNHDDNNDVSEKEGRVINKSLGFGFITFLCAVDADYVVDKCSGIKICNREVAIDYCMAKETYLKFGKSSDEQVIGDGDNKIDKIVDNISNRNDTLNVDSDSRKVVKQEGDDDTTADDDDDDDDIDDNEEEVEDQDADFDDDGDIDDGENHDGDDGDVDDDDENDKKNHVDDVGEGCTVFIRGLSFDTESNDLKRCLSRYGYITMAVIVKDKVTNISKGSAFVKYATVDSANNCIEDCLKNNNGMMMIKIDYVELT